MGKNRRQDEEKNKSKKVYTNNTNDDNKNVNGIKQTEMMVNTKNKVTKTMNLKLLLFSATCCGLLNVFHVSTMFENDRHFSHLSNLEREMSFRTEMGFYYYYYKVIVESDSFVTGLNRLMNDNRTEYPSTINTLQRFNLLPEVILGGAYHGFTYVLEFLEIPLPQVCYKVSRGGSLSPVISCEGIGDPMYWYLSGVWVCAGLTAALLFISGAQLSNSLLGGFITVICFFFNHGESTRVQWTPPLRESFAYPFNLIINIIITHSLRQPNLSWCLPLLFGNFAMIYLLSWQFSQYTLIVNIGILYIMYTVGVSSPFPMLLALLGSIYAYANTLIAQFFNPLLLISPLAGILVGVLLLTIFLEPLIQMLPSPMNVSVQLAFLFITSIASKMELSRFLSISDDGHIINLLRAKFSNYSDFHTSLYTCSNEFDFLPKETLNNYMDTLLLPCVLASSLIFIFHIFWRLKTNFIKRIDEYGKDESLKTAVWHGVDSALTFNFALLVFYGLMATLVMRLKLFLTPHMCVMASLLASKYLLQLFRRKELQYAFLVILVSVMSIRGLRNISEQRSIVGEYSNPNFEELIEWVNSEVGPDAAFAGPMPTMGNILLSTNQPIVNHPHYENAGLRHRTKLVYSVFSRKSVKEVHETLVNMKVSYVVLQKSWCLLKSKEGCGMVDLWDREEPQNIKRAPLCPKLFYRDSLPFHKVFSNEEYVVLQVPSKFVELRAPRSQKS